MHRREFLELLAAAGAAALPSGRTRAWADLAPADATLHIAPVELEIAARKTVKTVAYNGVVPGPPLRFREGQQVTIEVVNDTNEPELTHWHGLFIAPDVDGAEQEGTPLILAHSSSRYAFVPRPAGTRWYHSHVSAGRNLNRATYSGQFGMFIIEPRGDPGRYDAEHLVCLHGWKPYLSTMGGEGALEVAYELFSINGRALGHGEPIRVRQGQQVLLRILNASATLQHQIALAGHQLRVLSLDGNPVPTPQPVDIVTLGPAERADVLVTLNAPGVWILGELNDQIRNQGLGIVVEYENSSGAPRWIAPANAAWDYTLFGSAPLAGVSSPTAGGPSSAPAEEVIPLVFRRKFAGNNWVDHWTINGKEYPHTDRVPLRAQQRYRLRFDNQSDDDHPVHLHRHSFELKQIAGKNTAGIFKDVVVVPHRSQVEVELLADNPGLTLFHCHQQLHMDFGFMTLFEYRPS
jgi:FtsP/CotA-like multicopper oxidase with cupredoxin domain